MNMKTLFSKRNAVLALATALLLSNFSYAKAGASRNVAKQVSNPDYQNASASLENECTPVLVTVVAVTEAVVAVGEAVVATAAAYTAVKATEGFLAAADNASQEARLALLD
jgi:ABC-type Fe2+-enterobactin transport system substrate-binding protein